jgi:thiol-disulfide isomerase/thioredoxin
MNNKKRTILSVSFLIVFLLGAYLFYGYLQNQQNSAAPGGGQERTMSKDFVVQDEDGKEVRLSDFYGKPIVLNFWASWCPPCKSEMPDFNEVYNNLKGEVVFLMINETDGQRETVEKGSAYVKGEGFTFPVYYDTTLEAGYLYNVTAIPTTYFIDKEGYVVNYVRGAVSLTQLLDNIDKIK